MLVSLPAAVTSLVLVGAGAGAAVPASAVQSDDAVEGSWHAVAYELADGPVHPVRGMISFWESDWLVLFFVLDDDGVPRRASAEGGTYTLDGERLVFRHRYHFSGGDELAGLAASEFRMDVRTGADAPEEPTRIEVGDDRLTLHFPSGNRMRFRRGGTPGDMR